MKKISKQALSVLLTVIMIVTTALPAFAQSEEPQTNTQTDVSYESTNVLGDLILDNYQEQENESENVEYLITSVVIEDMTATVELKNLDACTVVVALYENNGGKMLASGKADIEANESVKENTVSVTIDTDEMPEYFYVKAFLVDANNAPLCKSYESMEYTKEFEEFMAKTTDDFDADKVINLDESEDNNFLVVSDDATVIAHEECKNTVVKDDYENGIYSIENADEQIKNLKKGDVFYYQYGEDKNDYIITKVENIVVNGDTVTIVAQQEVEMTDYFQYVKIDTESSRTTFDDSEMDPDVVHETVEEMPRTRTNIGGEYSVSDKWTATKDFGGGVSLQFSIKAKLSLGVKLYIDFDLFGEKYAYLEIILSCSSDIEFSLNGKVKVPPITLGVVGLDADMNEDLGIEAAVKFVFIVEAKIAINIKVSLLDAAIGFAFDSKTGFVNKSKAGILDFETKVEEKTTIFAGLALVPAVKITKHVKVDWESQFGVEVDATIPITSQDHKCSLCAKIDVDFVASSTIKVKFFDWIEKTTILGQLNIDIGEFYWSHEMGFGSGKCPNDSSTSGGDDSGSSDSDAEIEETRTVTGNGTCGDNLIWTLYDDGELVIDGTGAMKFVYYGTPHWWSHRYLITDITIGDSVTTIADSAFWSFEKFTSVTIGDSVKTIGMNAFSDCTSLTSIIIPDSVTTIGNYAFDGCSNLKNVTIGNNVTKIGDATFWHCSNLKTIIIPDSVTRIDNFAFADCDGIETVYYTGTEEQWNNIYFGSYNEDITNADIIFNYTPSTVALMSLLPDNKLSAYSESNMQVKTISDAVVGNEYVMIAVKDENAEDLLASSNLLYIDQKTAESEELTFEYVIDESITDYDVLVFGQKLHHYHLYDGKVTTAPTCTLRGVRTFTCSCGDSYTEPVAKLPGHTYETVVTAPTCTEQGFTTYTCSCGESYVADYVAAKGHTDEVIPGYAATCTETGLTDGVKCSVCGTVTTEQKTIPVVAHNDSNNDGLCDNCDSDLKKDCSHTCHSDNAFIQLFWKIINFLQKLFGVKSARYCECGVDHW